jgi:hypothetical protein
MGSGDDDDDDDDEHIRTGKFKVSASMTRIHPIDLEIDRATRRTTLTLSIYL